MKRPSLVSIISRGISSFCPKLENRPQTSRAVPITSTTACDLSADWSKPKVSPSILIDRLSAVRLSADFREVVASLVLLVLLDEGLSCLAAEKVAKVDMS